jgi:conjugative transfer signal peptidase TraF
VRVHATRVLGSLVCLTAATLTAAAILRALGVWINLSPSLPLGLYIARTVEHSATPGRNAVVLVCLPRALAEFGRARGYLPRGGCADGSAPVGKPVFAVAGDTVTVTSLGITRDRVAATNTGALRADSKGRPIVRVPNGRYPVPPGLLWLVSSRSSRSWDSRYYGPVPVTAVIGTLAPWHSLAMR